MGSEALGSELVKSCPSGSYAQPTAFFKTEGGGLLRREGGPLSLSFPHTGRQITPRLHGPEGNGLLALFLGRMQLLQPRRICTLVAASRHLHSLQVRHALRDARFLTRQKRLSDRPLRRARGWHESAPLLHDQRRFLLLRGGESADRQPQETRRVCLEVNGLTCGSCVAKAERALLSIDGVLEVRGTHAVYLWGTCTLQSATRPLASSTWWVAEL